MLEHMSRLSGRPPFADYAAAHPGLLEALLEYLKESISPIAAIAWRAWIAGSGKTAGAMAVVLDAATPRLDKNRALHGALKNTLRSLDAGLPELVDSGRDVLARWGRLADGLLLRLGDDRARDIPAEADVLVAVDDLDESLRDSRHLTRAFVATGTALAAAIEAFVEKPSVEAFQPACDALKRLEAHRLKDAPTHQRQVVGARMALRLMAYLCSRRDLDRDVAGVDEAMLARAEHYVSEGAFVDLARRVARGAPASPLDAAVQRMVAKADTLRDADDEAFAKGFVAWCAAGRRVGRVVPIESALDRFVVPFIQGDPRRKLLVLLLDGMSWASALELLADLEANHRNAPIRWRLPNTDARRLLPPMIAAVPTVTEVSRSSLFGGKLIAGEMGAGTAADPTRFADHRGLRKILDEVPRLLIAPRVTDPSGNASDDALKLIESDDRVVGMVLNAIDDQIKTGPQLRVEYTTAAIRALQKLLEKAIEAGRAILLIADHGHAPGVRMRRVLPGGETKSARWRDLAPGQSPEPYELVFEGPHQAHHRWADRAALLYRETDCYASGQREGEHGGASLAEVVTPAILIGAESLASDRTGTGRDDLDLTQIPFPRPAWWDLVVTAAVAVPAPTARALRSERPVPPTPQLPLFVQPTVESPPAPTPSRPQAVEQESPWRKRLRATEAFGKPSGERLRVYEDRIVPRLVVLADAGGMMSVDLFAQRMGVIAPRVVGAIRELQEWVDLEGNEVVSFDANARQVQLSLTLLHQMVGGSDE